MREELPSVAICEVPDRFPKGTWALHRRLAEFLEARQRGEAGRRVVESQVRWIPHTEEQRRQFLNRKRVQDEEKPARPYYIRRSSAATKQPTADAGNVNPRALQGNDEAGNAPARKARVRDLVRRRRGADRGPAPSAPRRRPSKRRPASRPARLANDFSNLGEIIARSLGIR